ncbi:hypothetical protein Q1695_001929 [Nippostrongylus brasiliensis]|nr:hypothetical protein Q1695_001929 [Nippostrongylus brasiliensis]
MNLLILLFYFQSVVVLPFIIPQPGFLAGLLKVFKSVCALEPLPTCLCSLFCQSFFNCPAACPENCPYPSRPNRAVGTIPPPLPAYPSYPSPPPRPIFYVRPTIPIRRGSILWAPPRVRDVYNSVSFRLPSVIPRANLTSGRTASQALIYAKRHKSRYFHVIETSSEAGRPAGEGLKPNRRSPSLPYTKHLSDSLSIAVKPHSHGENLSEDVDAASTTSPVLQRGTSHPNKWSTTTPPLFMPPPSLLFLAPPPLPPPPGSSYHPFTAKSRENSERSSRHLTYVPSDYGYDEEENASEKSFVVKPELVETKELEGDFRETLPTTVTPHTPVFVETSSIEVVTPHARKPTDARTDPDITESRETFVSSSWTSQRTSTTSTTQSVTQPENWREERLRTSESPLAALEEELQRFNGLQMERGSDFLVEKHRNSGIATKQTTKLPSDNLQSVYVDVRRRQKIKHAFGGKRRRPKCSSAELWNIMEQKMTGSSSSSKQLIYSAMLIEFPGRIANVICSRHTFSYIVVSSPIYCQLRKAPLTCFAFLQP